MRFRYLLLALALALAPAALWAGDLEDGQAAYKKGDYATALRLWRPLAEAGNASAQYGLGGAYLRGHGTPQDVDKGLELMRKAASKGHMDAQIELGFLLTMHIPKIPYDPVEGAKWFLMAAKQGDHFSQLQLIERYTRGIGVPVDLAQAEKWREASAEQLSADEQRELGRKYESGSKREGIRKDMLKAVKWYRLAAERGDSIAQWQLGWFYVDGSGVPQDYVVAHLWFNLAGASGQSGAVLARDDIARRMTPAQIAEAQKLAREWKPKK